MADQLMDETRTQAVVIGHDEEIGSFLIHLKMSASVPQIRSNVHAM